MAEADAAATAESKRQNFAARGSADSPMEADCPPTPPPGSAVRTPSRPSHTNNGNGRASTTFQEKRRVSSRPFSERRRTSVLIGQKSMDFLAETNPEEKGPKFVTFIIKQYKRWGYFIAEHDWQAIVICVLISLLANYKVLTTPQQNDITGYSPYGARARTEYTRYQEFFSHDGLGLAVYVFALAKDGGTMLRDQHLKEVVDILDYTSENFTLYDRGSNSTKTFNDFCISFCQFNEPVRQFYNGFTIQNDLASKGQQLSGRLVLKYPITSMFGRQLSMQNNFFGIELFNDTDVPEVRSEDVGVNETTEGFTPEELHESVTNMKTVKMVVLQFRAEHELGWTDADVKAYEMAVVNYFKDEYKSKNLHIYTLAQSYIEEEMVRAGVSLVPYLSVGFLIMCACACISVMMRAIYLHQHSLPKILLAVAACVLPFMSCATALAFMFLCGMRFASILCVIPFLVLAIGVDSSYLMIHEWQRVIQHSRNHPNRRNSQIGFRIAEVLSEVGPAILISALTNIFADAVGAFTSSPEITLLCVGNLTSMFVAYIYQMTCYAGLMSLIGRYEIKVEREERNRSELSLKDKKANVRKAPLTRQQSKFHEETKEAISKSMWAYVNFIANKAVATVVIVVYFVYLGISIFGITQININLSSQKLFSQDSPLLALDKLRVKYQVPHFTMATVFVNNPGNLTNTSRLVDLNHFVEDMEAIPGSWGPVGTKYFIRDFLSFENSFDEGFGLEGEEEPPEEPIQEEEANWASNSSIPTPREGVMATENRLASLYDSKDLRSFVEWPEYSFWSGLIRIDNDSHLEKFFFTTAYHGDQLSVWTERGKMLNAWRAVVDKYAAEFDASVFNEDGVFLDLIENMPADTWQSVVGALVCMGVVCYIFLNSWFAVAIATTAVLSICTGILGLISWWGIDLDPISMAAMIICVGSSCDLPAHTSFHYYLATVRGKNSTPQEKLANCLSTIAFPAIQAAVSMILCVSSLLFVHLYMSSVFVKTMTLCVILCNVHALVFIPAFLVMWDYIQHAFSKKHKIQPDAPQTPRSQSPDVENGKVSISRQRSPMSESSHNSPPDYGIGKRHHTIATTSPSGNHIEINPEDVIKEET